MPGLAALAGTLAGTVADALCRGLLPQWRARPEASRQVARGLGLRGYGGQLSVLLAPDGPGAEPEGQSSEDGGSA